MVERLAGDGRRNGLMAHRLPVLTNHAVTTGAPDRQAASLCLRSGRVAARGWETGDRSGYRHLPAAARGFDRNRGWGRAAGSRLRAAPVRHSAGAGGGAWRRRQAGHRRPGVRSGQPPAGSRLAISLPGPDPFFGSVRLVSGVYLLRAMDCRTGWPCSQTLVTSPFCATTAQQKGGCCTVQGISVPLMLLVCSLLCMGYVRASHAPHTHHHFSPLLHGFTSPPLP